MSVIVLRSIIGGRWPGVCSREKEAYPPALLLSMLSLGHIVYNTSFPILRLLLLRFFSSFRRGAHRKLLQLQNSSIFRNEPYMQTYILIGGPINLLIKLNAYFLKLKSKF